MGLDLRYGKCLWERTCSISDGQVSSMGQDDRQAVCQSSCSRHMKTGGKPRDNNNNIIITRHHIPTAEMFVP
ncbi:hypothetical protein EYF80_018437 [Liparis tanakae]|uniref:Uncharacterized protein n=1 Tax=Liparis tanakae TaxID=230148 RepID=A0A4Z2HZT0_9TELE|nr:hypothetical protein EYF80_018437 [Liparis tanakae]